MATCTLNTTYTSIGATVDLFFLKNQLQTNELLIELGFSPATMSAPKRTRFPDPPPIVVLGLLLDLAPVAPEKEEADGICIDPCVPLLAATGAGELYSARVSMTPLVLDGGPVSDGATRGKRGGAPGAVRMGGGWNVCCCCCCSCECRVGGTAASSVALFAPPPMRLLRALMRSRRLSTHSRLQILRGRS